MRARSRLLLVAIVVVHLLAARMQAQTPALSRVEGAEQRRRKRIAAEPALSPTLVCPRPSRVGEGAAGRNTLGR